MRQPPPELLAILHQHSGSAATPWLDLPQRERAAFRRIAKVIDDHYEHQRVNALDLVHKHSQKLDELFEERVEAMVAARSTDPETSHIAAQDSETRKHHRKLMLLAYWENRSRAISDHEAADDAGLLIEGICWWKRASDLRKQGLIKWATDHQGEKMTMPGMHGRPVGLCVLTDVGRKVAKREALAAQNC